MGFGVAGWASVQGASFMDLESIKYLHRFEVAEPQIGFPFSGASLHKRRTDFGLCPHHFPFSSQAKGLGQEAQDFPAREQVLVTE